MWFRLGVVVVLTVASLAGCRPSKPIKPSPASASSPSFTAELSPSARPANSPQEDAATLAEAGKTLALQADYIQAIVTLQKAYLLNPDNPLVSRWLYISYMMSGNHRLALFYAQRTVDLWPPGSIEATAAREFTECTLPEPEQRYISVDSYALAAPADKERTVKSLAGYLGDETRPEIDDSRPERVQENKARAIYRWITDRISYDDAAARNSIGADVTPAATLRRRRTICSGYSLLYHALAQEAGLKAVSIGGSAGRCGDVGPHAWNAVRIGKEWQLLDPTWGVQDMNVFFLSPPDQFILTHFPDDSHYQFLAKPHSRAQYLAAVHAQQEKNQDDYYMPPTEWQPGIYNPFSQHHGQVIQPSKGVLVEGETQRFRFRLPGANRMLIANGGFPVELNHEEHDEFTGTLTPKFGHLYVLANFYGSRPREDQVVEYLVRPCAPLPTLKEFLANAQQASTAINKQIDERLIKIHATVRAFPDGRRIFMEWKNLSQDQMEIRLKPGMLIQARQADGIRVLLKEEHTSEVAPGNISKFNLKCYALEADSPEVRAQCCFDAHPGQPERLSISVLRTSLGLEREDVLSPPEIGHLSSQHRHFLTQLAVWKVMGILEENDQIGAAFNAYYREDKPFKKKALLEMKRMVQASRREAAEPNR